MEEKRTIETLFFQYIDQVKFLFFPEEWGSMFLDYSKNEIFTLLLVYREKSVNMTRIAEYMQAPLNTATGVVARLEKKGMLKRERSPYDKRVVTIELTEKGNDFFKKVMDELSYYGEEIFGSLTEEEKETAFKVIDKVMKILRTDPEKRVEEKEKKEKRGCGEQTCGCQVEGEEVGWTGNLVLIDVNYCFWNG